MDVAVVVPGATMAFSKSLIRLCAVLTWGLAFPVACGGGEGGDAVDKDGTPSTVGVSCGLGGICSTEAAICDELRGCVECQFNEDCDDGMRCAAYACEPNVACEDSSQCEGLSTSVCNAETKHCEQCATNADCGESQRCGAGFRCVDVDNCLNSHDCAEGTVCNRDLGFCVACVSDNDCAEGSVCRDSACISACSSDKDCSEEGLLCDAAAGHCVECTHDVDCPDDYFCSAGKCVLDNCTPGEQFCDDALNAVYTCTEDGSGHAPLLCPSGTTCEGGKKSAACEPWICNPGETKCDVTSNVVQTCDATGLGYASELDCAEMDGRCENAACVEVTCTAGENFCQDGNSYACNALGTEATLAATCGGSQFCQPSTGLCESWLCTPNSATCDGDSVLRCNSEGSGYLEEVTDCTETEQLCVGGTCKDAICDFDRRCNGNILESCVDRGTRLSGFACSSNQHCMEGEDSALCKADICTQNTSYCSDNKWTVCNADGSAVAEQKNCGTLGMKCASGGCFAQIGSNSSSQSGNDNYLLVNHFQATEDATLTGIQQYMNVYSSTALTWVVFESSTEAGDYSLLDSKANSAASTNAIWHESPTFDVSLKAGSYYLIGVHVYNNDYSYYGTATLSESVGSLSFLGRSNVYDSLPLVNPRTVTAPATTSYAYYQRISFE